MRSSDCVALLTLLAGLTAFLPLALAHGPAKEAASVNPMDSELLSPQLRSLAKSTQFVTHAFLATDQPIPSKLNPIWIGWRVKSLVEALEAGKEEEAARLEREVRGMVDEGLGAVLQENPSLTVTISEHALELGTPDRLRGMPDMSTVAFIRWKNTTANEMRIWAANVDGGLAAFTGYDFNVPADGEFVTLHIVNPTVPGEGVMDIPVAAGREGMETPLTANVVWPVTVYQPATLMLRLEDAQTDRAVPARVAVSDSEGAVWSPLPPEELRGTSWLGQKAWGGFCGDGYRWAYVDGVAEIEVPGGIPVTVTAYRGPEYERPRVSVTVPPGGTAELVVPLARWSNVRERGYYPGDTHVHHMPPEYALREGSAEDLAVVNLLVTEWGQEGKTGHMENGTDVIEHFQGARPHQVSTTDTIVYVGEEFRNHLFGHLIFLNLIELVLPASTGKLPEHWPEGDNAPSNSRVSKGVIEQGGVVVSPHFRTTAYEAPAQAAHGTFHSVDILTLGDPQWRRSEKDRSALDWYYGFLNCGFRIAVSAGTDKMSKRVPIGFCRVYSKVNGEFTLKSWLDGIRAGNTFATNGPIIEITVDGNAPGTALTPGTGEVLTVLGSAKSFEPVNRLELVVNGEVVSETTSAEGVRELSISHEVTVDGPMWIAARVRGNKRFTHGSRGYPVWAHTSPVYIEAPGKLPSEDDAQHFMEVTRDLIVNVEGQAYESAAAKAEVIQDLRKAVQIYEGKLP